MPTIFAANESSILVDKVPVEGLRSLEYRHQQARTSVYAIGSAERVGMVSGPQVVEGRLRVVSTSPTLNALTTDKDFTLTAHLQQGKSSLTLTFDECFLQAKSFELGVGDHGEAVYEFTATRVREGE
jgi:hypothetical protein